MLILIGAVAGAFALAGLAKIVGVKPLADQFEEFGLPSWLMRLVGLLEIAGAVGLFVRPARFWAAAGLLGLMLGAVANHLKVRHAMSKAAPAFVLLILCAVIGVLSWGPEVWRPW